MNTHAPSPRTVIVQRHGSPSLTHQRLLGLCLGYADLQILFMSHLRLSCQNATAFQHRCSANDMMVACSWQQSPGDVEGNTTGMSRRASRGGEESKQETLLLRPVLHVLVRFILQLLFMAHNALHRLRQIPGKWKFRQVKSNSRQYQFYIKV